MKTENLFTMKSWGTPIESKETITPRKARMQGKRKMINKTRKEKVKEILESVPKKGEFWHIVSNGNFDYWSMIMAILEIGKVKDGIMHASTWTINRPNALEMLEQQDNGTLSHISLITGLYFKRRESAVYATISKGLLDRGGKMKCLENHAKVALIDDRKGNFYVMEGSANLTANPRIEQNIVANSKELYEHHRAWIEEALEK
jgi:hypothetical protein